MRFMAVLCLALAACSGTRETGAAPIPFPRGWIGEWKGTVEMHSPGGARPGFEMVRRIAATEDPDRYAWTTIYRGPAGEQERNYTLLVRDAAAGHFAVDEHNGIVLEARMLGDTLYTWFRVQGSHLLVKERVVGDTLHFDIITAPESSRSETGERIPVDCLLPGTQQRARLQRR